VPDSRGWWGSQPTEIVAPSAGRGACEQILDDFADFHELIQPGRLGDEPRNS
jgi:hypothetical protein